MATLCTALVVAATVALAMLAWRDASRYRRVYPALSRACVVAMVCLLAAHLTAPALGVPAWTFYAAATLNMFLFALLWLPRLR